LSRSILTLNDEPTTPNLRLSLNAQGADGIQSVIARLAIVVGNAPLGLDLISVSRRCFRTSPSRRQNQARNRGIIFSLDCQEETVVAGVSPALNPVLARA
jgi:hypothetical protein